MALYLPEHNALFVHAPKTGGTYVTRVLTHLLPVKVREVGYKHSHKDLVGPIRFRKRPYTFSFVRHPLTWYSSYWQMKMRRAQHWHFWQPKSLWHPNWEIDPAMGSDDFSQWIRNVSSRPNFLHDMYRHYTGRGTRDEVDFVGKQERLDDDLLRVFDTLGIACDRQALEEFGRVNVGRSEAKPEYTEELRDLILASEADTIRAYGYTDDPKVLDA